jgi:hypothetical protein
VTIRSSQDAPAFVEELGIALLAGFQVEHIGRDQRLERPRRGGVVGAGDGRLPHMRDVEQPGVLARPKVFGQDAGRVLHRHAVAGEPNHAGARGEVRGVERRAEQGFGRRARPSDPRTRGKRADKPVRAPSVPMT